MWYHTWVVYSENSVSQAGGAGGGGVGEDVITSTYKAQQYIRRWRSGERKLSEGKFLKYSWEFSHPFLLYPFTKSPFFLATH